MNDKSLNDGDGVNKHPAADASDASLDQRLRELIGPVTPLVPPPYGFERVVLRARRRRNRAALIAAAAGVVAVAVAAGGVIAGTHLSGNGLQVAGCDTVGRAAPAAWVGGSGNGLPGGPGGNGSGREVMNRKYEWAIGGVLTAAALSVGIIAGCSSSADANGPSASATESGAPPSASQTPGTVTLPPSSSSSGAASSSADSGSGSSPVAGPPRCHTADLSPAVAIVAGSQGAGHESINIRLTNTSGHTCTVYGFPGMKLEDANSSGQATTVNRDHGIPTKTITVADGASVATTANFDFDVPASDEPPTGNCEAPSVYLQITPPDETTQLVATISGGPVTVCEHGTISVLPFIAGTKGANQ